MKKQREQQAPGAGTGARGLLSRETDSDTINPGDHDREEMLTNTRLLQQALDGKAAQGGGVVVVPPGVFWIRTLFIPSFTELRLAAGSRLLAWPYAQDYEPYRRTREEKSGTWIGNSFAGLSLIVSSNTDRAALTGRGIVDGNGFAFWDIPPRQHVKRGGRKADLEVAEHWEDESPFWRPKRTRLIPLIELDSCRDVLIRDVTIANHLYGPNTDGIDINGCRDVTVRGCVISCGDDAIIIKATERARSCERICISDCVLETHCAAIGIGAEVVFPIRDVTATGITIRRALRMIQIELWDPGLVENVVISSVAGATMTDIPLERPIYVDIQHYGRTDGRLGAVRNVQVHGLSAVTRGRCLFTAADGSTIDRLILSGIQLTYPEIENPEISVTSSHSSQMSNDNPRTRAARSAFVFDNVRAACVRDVQIQWPQADRADRAGALRGPYDWGELSSDKRKQESLAKEPAMNAFLFRNSSRIVVDAPLVEGNNAPLCRLEGHNDNVVVNGSEIGAEGS